MTTLSQQVSADVTALIMGKPSPTIAKQQRSVAAEARAKAAKAAPAPAKAPARAKAAPVATKPEGRCYTLSDKGAAFTPVPAASKVKGDQNQVSWLAIKAMFKKAKSCSEAELQAAVPSHRNFVRYAARRGWLLAS